MFTLARAAFDTLRPVSYARSSRTALTVRPVAVVVWANFLTHDHHHTLPQDLDGDWLLMFIANSFNLLFLYSIYCQLSVI
ncbi:MAG: hypothetical protein M1600_00265 [Firmicutes bacterium]|jgi:hypothetical protein|nr:hypothetical protein [Bacillota bacterium]